MALRIYKRAWVNPWPNEEILALDFESTMANSALFLVALTCEEQKPPANRPKAAATIINTLQSKAEDFQRLEPGKFARLQLNERPIKIGAQYYDGFRFKTPAQGHMDLVWASRRAPDFQARAWYILPIHGVMKVGFEDWYHSAPDAGRNDADKYGMTLQFLSGKKLEPGHDYFIWFVFDEARPQELEAALRFVPAGEIDNNKPETLLRAMPLEPGRGSEPLKFHRHFCLGSLR
jgi:hypothetical protein